MKHRIEVRVKNKEKVLDGRVMKLPARLVHWLFGDGMKVLVITPGDTVGHVDIYPETAGKGNESRTVIFRTRLQRRQLAHWTTLSEHGEMIIRNC